MNKIQLEKGFITIDQKESNPQAVIILKDRGKHNMVHCKVGDILIYHSDYDGEDDHCCTYFKNSRTGKLISDTILFETSWADKITGHSGVPCLMNTTLPIIKDKQYKEFKKKNI